jgi:hypothetical protein
MGHDHLVAAQRMRRDGSWGLADGGLRRSWRGNAGRDARAADFLIWAADGSCASDQAQGCCRASQREACAIERRRRG